MKITKLHISSLLITLLALFVFAGCTPTTDTPVGTQLIAMGLVSASGAITNQTGNFSVAHTGTGEYAISSSTYNFSDAKNNVIITIAQNGGAFTSWYVLSSTLYINTRNQAGTAADYAFSFQVWE